MELLKIALFIIGLLVGGFTIYCIWHKCVHRVMPWNDDVVNSYIDWCGEQKYRSFNEMYELHSKENYSKITTHLPFSTFKSLYAVNPERWYFNTNLCGRNKTFELIYNKPGAPGYRSEQIQVIFNKADFDKFRHFCVDLQKQEQMKVDNKKLQKDLAVCEEIVASAQADIQKLVEQSEKEMEEVSAAARKTIKEPKLVKEYDKDGNSYFYFR